MKLGRIYLFGKIVHFKRNQTHIEVVEIGRKFVILFFSQPVKIRELPSSAIAKRFE